MTISKEQLNIIVKITEKAKERGLLMFDKMSLIMDMECATKEFDLKLNDLLQADDFNFAHDISGIQNNLNRKTKKFENYFIPRFAKIE